MENLNLNLEQVISSTKSTTITIATTKGITKPAKNALPSAIELSGTTTENYWKDYQLLGLFKIHGTRNGAPSYKRARNAFILGRDRLIGIRLGFLIKDLT